MNHMPISLFATCPKGLESLLMLELSELKATNTKETVAGVSFSGNMELAYRACLWSRLASRILLLLCEVTTKNRENLYHGVQSVDWSNHLDSSTSFRVDFSGFLPGIQHTRYGAQVVKDAIVDQLRDKFGWRPPVNISHPDIKINVRARDEKVSISIDLSGQSLHQRGYRLEAGEAPLKENLAAAILLRAGWPKMAKKGATILDPLCGSGTLVIEATLMAADIAPGLLRTHFGFDKWLGHIPKIWLTVLEDARARRKAGLAQLLPSIIGYDALPNIITLAKANSERAGIASIVTIKQQELHHLKIDDMAPGLVISNPPYGERMGNEDSLIYFYRHLGDKLKSQCSGWQAGIFTGAPELCRSMGLTPRKQYSLFNGALPCKLFIYDIHERQPKVELTHEVAATPIISNSAGATMFANRLTKNLRLMRKWAIKQNIECYRIYDADMPEYAIVVDLYKNWAHVQEYSAPSSVDPNKARQRLQDALGVIPQILGIPKKQVVFKLRERQSGIKQYNRQATTGEMLEVKENNCRLLVNLKDYLDTGLFLDHRLIRQRLYREAEGKHFLNLFCYTATASVHAGLGGAASTTSVDLSKNYLGWARKNFSINGLSEQKHILEQANCMEWLEKEERQYDLIFIDPPTFSNSKRMKDVFDIQSDHSRLIDLAMKRLRKKQGILYFSNNFKRFKLNSILERQYSVIEITPNTIDNDFKRRGGGHRSWVIRHI